MRVLHIGYGFTPWRGGGLIEYAEDLMEEQVKHGYDVFYFCSGRHYPLMKKTMIRKWLRAGYTIFEVINPPIYHGGDIGTIFDLECEVIEQIFASVLEQVKPDIIHIQELAGLPASLIDIIAEKNIPMVMTLHDYFLLCPTLKLFDFQFENCRDLDPAEKCIRCIGDVKNNKIKLWRNTILYELKRCSLVFSLIRKVYRVVRRFKQICKITNKVTMKSFTAQDLPSLTKFFKERRKINIERLKKIDLLIAQSKAVERIYRFFLGSSNIVTIHSTVKHLEKIQPKRISINKVINFGTLNGFASVPKGAFLLLEALKILKNRGLIPHFQLHVFGGILPQVKDQVLQFPNVAYYGGYSIRDLDKILNLIDVGIIPSVWEEAYGYVGVEFLAKGIPVIGNNIGGIVDYTIDSVTGWVNKSCSPEELAEIIQKIIQNPREVENLNHSILEGRNKIIKSMYNHFIELENVYKEVIQNKKYDKIR